MATDLGYDSDCHRRQDGRTCVTTWADTATEYCPACVREQFALLCDALEKTRAELATAKRERSARDEYLRRRGMTIMFDAWDAAECKQCGDTGLLWPITGGVRPTVSMPCACKDGSNDD